MAEATASAPRNDPGGGESSSLSPSNPVIPCSSQKRSEASRHTILPKQQSHLLTFPSEQFESFEKSVTGAIEQAGAIRSMDILHIPGDRDFRTEASVVTYVDLAGSKGEPLNSSIPMDVEDVDGRSSARKRPASGQAISPDISPNKIEGNHSDNPAKKKDKKYDSASITGESRTGLSEVDTSAGTTRFVNTKKGRSSKECDNKVVNNKVEHYNSPSVSTVEAQNIRDKNHNRKNYMKYSAKDCAPFIVYIYSGEGAKPAHPLHISRMMRAGIIRDVPIDWGEETVRKAISSPCNILEVRRINRRVRVNGELRIGYIGSSCRSKPRCLYWGNRHEEGDSCPNKDRAISCINCRGDHLAISRECPLIIRHKKMALASAENIPLSEAKRRVNNDPPHFSSIAKSPAPFRHADPSK